MIKLPTLYKFSSTGKVQQWDIRIEKTALGACYIAEWGQVGGSIQATRVEVNSGKNIGKANETTPLQQAISEAESKWKKQLDKGYAQGAPVKTAQTSPMLAKSYDKEKHKVKFPCFYQPKLDGMRCIAEKSNGKVRLVSRKGKPIDTLPHINSVLEGIMDNGDVLDGELYCHDIPFQTVMSWVKRNQKNSSRIKYNVYDIVMNKPYKGRFKHLCNIIGHKGRGVVKTVYTDIVNSHEEVIEAHENQVRLGYEGIMLRWGNEPYKVGKRSSHLLKVKSFQDEEFEIIDAFENIGKQSGQCTFTCKTNDGGIFNVKPMGTDQERCRYWEDFKAGKIKGKMLTVRFFEWTTSDPKVPRFPVGVVIRDYE